MSLGAITHTLFSAASATASAAGGGNFAAAMNAATGTSQAAATTVSNPFSQMGTDLQSLLVQLGGSHEAKDTSATTASANNAAALHGSHDHHHGAHAHEGSGDLATDFANNTIN